MPAPLHRPPPLAQGLRKILTPKLLALPPGGSERPKFSWPDPRGYDPFKVRIEGHRLVGDSRMQDYWEKGSSIESRLLDMLRLGTPLSEVKDRRLYENLTEVDRETINSKACKRLDQESVRTLMHFDKMFRDACQAKGYQQDIMLAASYMNILGKLNYSWSRYPFTAHKEKDLRSYFICKIADLAGHYYKNQKDIELPAKAPDKLRELHETYKEFVELALDSLAQRRTSAFGPHGPARWLHQVQRYHRTARRLELLEQDFGVKDPKDHMSILQPFVSILNHLPLATQVFGVLVNTVYSIKNLDYKKTLETLAKVYYSGPEVETTMTRSLKDNPHLIYRFVAELKSMSQKLASDLSSAQSPLRDHGFDATSIFLGKLMYLRFKILKNTPQIPMTARMQLLEHLDREIYAFSRQPDLEGVPSPIVHRPPETADLEVKEESVDTLIQEFEQSMELASGSRYNDEQKRRFRKALEYLRSDFQLYIDRVVENMLVEHLTIADMAQISKLPDHFQYLVDSYTDPADEPVPGFQTNPQQTAEKLIKSIVLTVATPAAATALGLILA